MKSCLVTKQYIPEECTIALQHCYEYETLASDGNYQVSNLASELYSMDGYYGHQYSVDFGIPNSLLIWRIDT